MTLTTVKSAYPAPIEALMPRARALAEVEGLPSRNRLKAELRIGAPKAKAIRESLVAEGFAEDGPELTRRAESVDPGRAIVTEPEPATETDSVTAPVSVDTGPGEMPVSGPVPGRQDATVELPVIVEPNDANEPGTAVADPGSADGTVAVEPVPATGAEPTTDTVKADPAEQATGSTQPEPAEAVEPGPAESEAVKPVKRLAVWPVLLLLLPATVAIWSGWVGLGQLAGFGPVNPLPGIADDFEINTAITLPIGMETYSAYALYVWLSGRASAKAVSFARASSILALLIGSAGQIAYHLIAAPDAGAGPFITAAVACIPVAVLGLGASLAHLVQNGDNT